MAEKKSLVIVESPSKAKTINKYLGSDFVVEASVGHIKNLPETRLGVDVENNYEPQYVLIKGKKEVIKRLQKIAANSNKVFVATDPDREGEAIAWHIASEIEAQNSNIQRILINEITKSGVSDAMRSPLIIDMNKVNSQQARRILDRLVGYNVSPFLWKVFRKGLSAGRVQSVALRLVCEREEEIANFKIEEYWSITGVFRDEKSPGDVSAKLIQIDGKKAEIGNEGVANGFVEDIRKKKFVIKSVVKKETKRNPVPPFITSSLQQEASRKLNYSPKKTMMVAQQLYEGVDIGREGPTGLITYMRTDSTRISDSALEKVRVLILNSYGKEYLPEKPVVYKSKKKTKVQDAHEAIRPTELDEAHSPKSIKKHLTADQRKLYELIWNRFVACQMKPAVMDQTGVDIVGDEYLFRATGSVMKFRGFLQVYEESLDDESGTNGEGENASLPAFLKPGLAVILSKIEPRQHFTKPPARYTQSSLVKDLDAKGIGRPSTYALIISNIQSRGYVELKERRLFATDLGMTVNKILVKYFPKLFNVEFTAGLEEQLDEVESGRLKYYDVVDRFYKPLLGLIEEAQSKKSEIKDLIEEKVDITCDECGKPMIVKWGRYGKFISCSDYPNCKNIKNIDELNGGDAKEGAPGESPDQTDEVCGKCGSPMVFKNGPYGKYLACSKYPDCKTTKSIVESTGVPCPKDGGDIVKRRTRRGKMFFGCANYPKCDFALWNEPVSQKCQKCSHSYLLKKYSKKKGNFLQCPECKEVYELETSE